MHRSRDAEAFFGFRPLSTQWMKVAPDSGSILPVCSAFTDCAAHSALACCDAGAAARRRLLHDVAGISSVDRIASRLQRCMASSRSGAPHSPGPKLQPAGEADASARVGRLRVRSLGSGTAHIRSAWNRRVRSAAIPRGRRSAKERARRTSDDQAPERSAFPPSSFGRTER